MFVMGIILFLSLGLVLVYCKTIEDKFETKIGQPIQQNEFESDVQEKREVDKATIDENNSFDLEEMIKEEKMNINNKNSNKEELHLKGKPNSADLWKESLLSYMDLNKSPRGTYSGSCTTSIQCVFWAGDINCRCSFFSCRTIL
jgi:hypothetical protein